ncbi:MAG: hypothetical protein ACLUOI_26915 [Eisenbergiella sp.]
MLIEGSGRQDGMEQFDCLTRRWVYAYAKAPENRAAVIKSLKPRKRSVRLLGAGNGILQYCGLTVNWRTFPTEYNCSLGDAGIRIKTDKKIIKTLPVFGALPFRRTARLAGGDF